MKKGKQDAALRPQATIVGRAGLPRPRPRCYRVVGSALSSSSLLPKGLSSTPWPLWRVKRVKPKPLSSLLLRLRGADSIMGTRPRFTGGRLAAGKGTLESSPENHPSSKNRELWRRLP